MISRCMRGLVSGAWGYVRGAEVGCQELPRENVLPFVYLLHLALFPGRVCIRLGAILMVTGGNNTHPLQAQRKKDFVCEATQSTSQRNQKLFGGEAANFLGVRIKLFV